MRLRLFAAATVLTGWLFAADPGLVSLAMPDSQVMAGINVEQVTLSPFGQYLLAQAGQFPGAGLQELIETAGFDPRRDLREILVSSNGRPGGSAIILARGAFDVPKILEAVRASGADDCVRLMPSAFRISGHGRCAFTGTSRSSAASGA